MYSHQLPERKIGEEHLCIVIKNPLQRYVKFSGINGLNDLIGHF